MAEVVPSRAGTTGDLSPGGQLVLAGAASVELSRKKKNNLLLHQAEPSHPMFIHVSVLAPTNCPIGSTE